MVRIVFERTGLLLPLLPSSGQVMAQALQFLALLLMQSGLSLQLAAAGVKPGQARLNGQELVFPEGLDLLLEDLQFSAGLVELLLTRADGGGIPLLLSLESRPAGGEILQGLLCRFKGEHHLLLASQTQPLPQLLVLAGLGAILLQPLATAQEFLFDDATAILALLNVIEFAAGLFDAAVEQGNPCQFVDDAAAVAVAHRHDPGHIALHHHVAALRVDAQATQLGLQLLEIAGDAVCAVGGAVGAPRHHTQLAGDGPFGLPGLDPGAFLGGIKTLFRCVRLPFTEIETHTHGGLGGLAGLENSAVDEVRQAIGPHAAAGGQTEAEQHTIEDVALARSIRPCHHCESLLERNAHRPAEGLEMRQPNLIDVNQQESRLSVA